MHNYHQVKLWHEEYDSKSAASRGDRVEDAELAFNRNYVHQKLEHGLLRVWRVRSRRCEEWTFVCADVALYLCNSVTNVSTTSTLPEIYGANRELNAKTWLIEFIWEVI